MLVLALGLTMATTSEVSAPGEPDVSVEVAMRDGLELPLKAWLPSGEGPWPVVPVRWYDTVPPGHIGPSAFLAGGYAFAVQAFRDGKGGDVRGKPGTRFTRDDVDGYDTVEWIAEQSWRNGQVAMTGKSAGGITAFQAATAQPPHLTAVIPQNYGGSFGTWGGPGLPGQWRRDVGMTADSGARLPSGPALGLPSMGTTPTRLLTSHRTDSKRGGRGPQGPRMPPDPPNRCRHRVTDQNR